MFSFRMKMFKWSPFDDALTMRDAQQPVNDKIRGDELTTRLCQLAYL